MDRVFFEGSNFGRILKDYIDTEELITPSIVLAEVARKYRREGMKEEDDVKRLSFIVASSNHTSILNIVF